VLPTTTTVTLLTTTAYVVLAAAAAILWRRSRSLRTALVAIGFSLVLPDQVTRLIEYYEFVGVLHGRPADTLFLIHHHAFLYYASILGLWVAAVGLAWHATARPVR